MRKNPNYLAEKEIKIYEDTYLGDEPVAPENINWDSVVQRGEFYYATQFPSNKNPMGRVKYIFPNSEAIYIHDTAARGLFDKERRAFSHGCIRIEKPYELAHHVLGATQHSPKMQHVYDYFRSKKPTKVYLPEPLPVHLVYIPAWVDNYGSVQFRQDIYNKVTPNIRLDRSVLAPFIDHTHLASRPVNQQPFKVKHLYDKAPVPSKPASRTFLADNKYQDKNVNNSMRSQVFNQEKQ